ncbi:hypothetical protein EJB05_06573, partial [Eragrostis curvula]
MAEARAIGSLPVANVQELAAAFNRSDNQVPERYLVKEASTDGELVGVVSGEDSSLEIPVIDLAKLLDPRSSEAEFAKLGSGCHDWGFFQLINHGVPYEVAGNLMNDVAEFFKQPLEARKACSQQPGSLEGYGQSVVVSEDQKLDWGDMLYLQVQPAASRDLRFWPTHPASFGCSVDVYSSATAKLSCRLLEFMAKAVGAKPASLLGVFEGQPVGMRVNYYPPCWQADQVIGLSPHTDGGGLTLLRQKNDDVQGLQINKDGKWFAVDILDGAFVVNVGDALEVLSNGKFKSEEHRAVIHPNKERISVAMFHFPCQGCWALCRSSWRKVKKCGIDQRVTRISLCNILQQNLMEGKHVERMKLE